MSDFTEIKPVRRAQAAVTASICAKSQTPIWPFITELDAHQLKLV